MMRGVWSKVRLGAFVRHLVEIAEKPCVLTIHVVSTGGAIRLTGILRAYYSLSSLHGWALVPPQQHGGFTTMRLTQLHLEQTTRREVRLDAAGGRRLRFTGRGEAIFELEREHLRGTVLTAPPRATGRGRYIYAGGRRRPAPEAWMLR